MFDCIKSGSDDGDQRFAGLRLLFDPPQPQATFQASGQGCCVHRGNGLHLLNYSGLPYAGVQRVFYRETGGFNANRIEVSCSIPGDFGNGTGIVAINRTESTGQ